MSSFHKRPHNQELGVPRPAPPGQHGSCGRVAASVIGRKKSQRGRRDGSIPPLPSVREARPAPATSLHASVSSFPSPPCSTWPFSGYLLIIKKKKPKNGHLARLLPAYDANLPSGFCTSLLFFVFFFPSMSTLPFMLLFSRSHL